MKRLGYHESFLDQSWATHPTDSDKRRHSISNRLLNQLDMLGQSSKLDLFCLLQPVPDICLSLYLLDTRNNQLGLKLDPSKFLVSIQDLAPIKT